MAERAKDAAIGIFRRSPTKLTSQGALGRFAASSSMRRPCAGWRARVVCPSVNVAQRRE